MKLKNLNLILISVAAIVLSAPTSAFNINCNARQLAADGSYYQVQASDKIDVIAHAEPDLPPVALPTKQKKKQKSSTNIFSWLTKSHTMPSLHFIEFIELFSDDES